MDNVIDLNQYRLRKVEELEYFDCIEIDEFELSLLERLDILDEKLDEINLNQIRLEQKMIDFIESFNELMRD